jgi:hypothetical protein
VTGGAAFSYDAYTRLCQTRAAFTFAASGFSALRAGFSASVNGFFNDWNAAPGAAPLTSDSVAGGGLSFSAAFPFAKFTLAGSYRLYPAKLPETLKEEYSVSLAAFPRAASKGADNGKAPGFRGAPDCRLRFDAARNSASFSAELTASASWRVSLRGLSVSAKLAAAIPLPQ